MIMDRTSKIVDRTLTDASGRIYKLSLTDRKVEKHLDMQVQCDDTFAYTEPTGAGIVVHLHIRNAPRYILETLIEEMKGMLDSL